MTTYLGNLSTFHYKEQKWDVFLNRVKNFFKVNNIKENKSNILLTYLSDETYLLARNLVHPKDIEELPFDDLVEVLSDHFTPRRSTLAERAIFYSANKMANETMEEWLARLRGLAVHCNFGGALNTALRDRFILGLPDGPERNKLIEQDEKSLTVPKALEIAQQTACVRKLRLTLNGDSIGPGTLSPAIKEEALFSVTSGTRGGRAAMGPQASPRQGTSRKCQDNDNHQFCSVCGLKSHSAISCRYKNYSCLKCGKKGHLKKVCSASKFKTNLNNITEGDDELVVGECRECELFNLRYDTYEPFTVTVQVNTKMLKMQIDSGSGLTVISDRDYYEQFSTCKLSKCNMRFCFYTGHNIEPIGYFWAKIKFNNIEKCIRIFVINNGGPPLLGRDFMQQFNVNFTFLHNVSLNKQTEVCELLERYADVWKDELGRFNKFKVSLHLKPTAKPKFFKPRPVPFALKDKVEAELERLVQLGILRPVSYSKYGTPIVPVLKANGSIRICGDYALTINKDLEVDKYPLPRIEEVFAKLQGGEKYSKIDLKMAYNQLELTSHDSSQELTTINTSKGLFQYTRLVFGLANAPAIFQRAMENLLIGIEGVVVWLDDICITAPNNKIHLERLEEVLKRLQDAGLRLQRNKCDFFQDSVTYLGYVIDKNGLRTCPKKIEAINLAPQPTNVKEVKRFMGMVNYYRKFIPNASSIMSPMNELLRDEASWEWGDRHQKAFDRVKKELGSERVLAHFDPEERLVLEVDAGPGGLGAVLTQGSEGQERPLAFASRSLSVSEKNYSQIHKEATAIIFGVKYFHQYLYGRSEPFVLKTDHKPLLAIFGKKNGISVMAASRLQRYAIYLAAYNYTIQYIRTDKNVIADYFSRSPAPLSDVVSECQDPEVSYVKFLDDDTIPLSYVDIKNATAVDRTLQTVFKYMRKGWPRKIKCKWIQPYFRCKMDLEEQDGCLFRGHRIVIPRVMTDKLLTELHKVHFGIVKTKAMARSRMWWPGIDSDIERTVGACGTCAALRPAPARAPPAPWPRPPQPWWRIHIDYMSLGQKTYLVVVDAYSKWLECLPMHSGTTTRALILKLKYIFSRLGIPKVIVSDNDTKIKTFEFEHFCKINGIEHVTSPIYHPMSNGQAENSVRTCKKMIKSIFISDIKPGNIDEILLQYLFQYRNTTHSSTGLTPAMLMYGRDLRCRLDLVCPSKNKHVNRGSEIKCRFFKIGDKVWLRWYVAKKPTWIVGVVTKIIGNRMYSVSINNNLKSVTRHIDQLLRFTDKDNAEEAVTSASGAAHSRPVSAPVRSVIYSAPTTSPSVHLPAPAPTCSDVHKSNGSPNPQTLRNNESDSERFVDARDSAEGGTTEAGEPDGRSNGSTLNSDAISPPVPRCPYNLRTRKNICYKE